MFDIETGTLIFDNLQVSIGPKLSRTPFLQSVLAVDARTLVANEPWHSWVLKHHFICGLTFVVAVYFHAETLKWVYLSNTDPQFGTNWSDWSEEKELALKAIHDAWLDETFKSRRRFPWGTVESVYDEKGGSSSIIFTFDSLA
jgi:hypothetical protein